MRNRIKQFFGWLFKGIKALWQIGWKKIMDFVTNIEAANELLDKLEKNDYVIIPEKMSRVHKAVSLVSGCCHSFFNRFLKRTDKEQFLGMSMSSCLTLTSLRTGCEGREDV